MVYHPYLRGKQFELVALREIAPVLQAHGFVPIVEPVREQVSGLSRALKTLSDHNVRSIVVANPQLGDHSSDSAQVSQLIRGLDSDETTVLPGIVATAEMSVSDVMRIWDAHRESSIVLVHAGFTEAEALAEAAANRGDISANIFLEHLSGKLYRRHFQGLGESILIRDGFTRMRNRDYPPEEQFSELHITYTMEGADGFGDFLIVGDNYSESGGPAYAVAIHLTYVDNARDKEMFVRHFKSDRQDTPQDPAGKFAEALAKLVDFLDSHPDRVLESSAVAEFRELHRSRHFPGLGYVKKLSMKHHIEVMADFINTNRESE